MWNLLTIAKNPTFGNMPHTQNFLWSTANIADKQFILSFKGKTQKDQISVEISVPDSIISGQDSIEVRRLWGAHTCL